MKVILKVRKAQDQKVRPVLECRVKVILKVKDLKVNKDPKERLDPKVNKDLLPATSNQAAERWGPKTLLVREVMALEVVETFSQVEMTLVGVTSEVMMPLEAALEEMILKVGLEEMTLLEKNLEEMTLVGVTSEEMTSEEMTSEEKMILEAMML